MIDRLFKTLRHRKQRRRYADVDTALAINLPLQVVLIEPDGNLFQTVGRPFGHSREERLLLAKCLQSWMKEDLDELRLVVIAVTPDVKRQLEALA